MPPRRFGHPEGDFLFSLINAGRLYHLNPDTCQEKTNKKFIRRFNYIEAHSIKARKPLKDMTLGEMDVLWNEAKAQERDEYLLLSVPCHERK